MAGEKTVYVVTSNFEHRCESGSSPRGVTTKEELAQAWVEKQQKAENDGYSWYDYEAFELDDPEVFPEAATQQDERVFVEVGNRYGEQKGHYIDLEDVEYCPGTPISDEQLEKILTSLGKKLRKEGLE